MITTAIMETIPMLMDFRQHPLGAVLASFEEEYHVSLNSYSELPNGKSRVSFKGCEEDVIHFLMNEFHLSWGEYEEYIASEYNALPAYINIIVFSNLMIENGWKEKSNKMEGYSHPYEYDLSYTKTIKGKVHEIFIPILNSCPDIHIRKYENDIMETMETLLSMGTKMKFHETIEFINTLETD